MQLCSVEKHDGLGSRSPLIRMYNHKTPPIEGMLSPKGGAKVEVFEWGGVEIIPPFSSCKRFPQIFDGSALG